MELATENGLGIDLIDMAARAAGAFLAPPGEAPTGPPSPSEPRFPGAAGAGTQVSPTIQTRISPQISPVMTQMQASPGAAVQAAPTMYPGGPQTATVPMGVPGLPPPPMGPPQAIPQYGYSPQPTGAGIPWGTPTAMQTGEQKINWTMIAIAGAAAIAAMAVFGPRRKRQN
jgi:LPXTG-motif cell wall-anchored protein